MSKKVKRAVGIPFEKLKDIKETVREEEREFERLRGSYEKALLNRD